METIPTTSRSLDRYYHINGDTFEKQYKEVLSGYREWSELSHAEDWLVFPENIGESICIDETAPSNGELYTIVSNRTSHGGKGTIIAIVKGVAADVVTEALMRIEDDKRLMVKEITMDMSNSMRLIARRCFPNAMRTIDRFHIQKLACDALQEMRIAHRWDAIQADTDAREEAKCLGEAYTPIVLANGDTHKQLLVRSRYLLFKSADKWTESQRQRAEVLFETYPDLKEAYSLTHSSSNPQPIGFSGILLAKRQNSFYCTYFLHNRNVADTKSPYPIKRLEVIRWFNQKSMVFNQSLS